MKEKPTTEDIDKNLTAINKNLKLLNDSNKLKEVTIRGLVNGISSGIGATIGLAIVIFLITQIVRQFSYLPYVEQFLKDTKLDKIIQYQVQIIEKTDNTDNVEVK